MKMRWGRIAIATLLCELLPMGLLLVAVAAFGPRDPFGAAFFADAAGHWIGPIAGAAAAFFGALWVVRPLKAGKVLHGAAIGCALAILDVAILVILRTPFEWLFVYSNLGKICAGWLGGFLAARYLRMSVRHASVNR
jgi:hypothetical protein